MNRLLLRCLILCVALAIGSCAQLNALLGGLGGAAAKIDLPNVSLKEVALAETPSQKMLTAYFCPRVLKEKLNLGFAADMLCTQFFGAAPAVQSMKVSFDVRVNVANPNKIPIPLASALTSVNVFPGAQESQLGAACVSMCAPEDPACTAKDQNSCPTSATDITNRADIAAALGKMLFAEGARLASGEPLGIKAPQVLSNDNLDVVVRLAFDPNQLLPVLQRFATNFAQDMKQGRGLNINIPYALSGTMFTGNLGSAGVLSAPFGPVQGNFQPQL